MLKIFIILYSLCIFNVNAQSISSEERVIKNQESVNLAVKMLEEASIHFPISHRNFVDKKFLFSLIKILKSVPIYFDKDYNFCGVYDFEYIACTNGIFGINVTPIFYEFPVNIRANNLIHEAQHLLNDSNECRVSQISALIAKNTILSHGLAGASYASCDFHSKMECGFPISLTQINKNHFANKMYKNREPLARTLLIIRVNGWVGGKTNCSIEYPDDLNRDKKLSLGEILKP